MTFNNTVDFKILTSSQSILLKRNLLYLLMKDTKVFFPKQKKTINKNAIYFYEKIYHIFDRK